MNLSKGKTEVQESSVHGINPVYDTAKSCLVNLVKSKCEEAIRLNEELHFTGNTSAAGPVSKGAALFQEARYRFVNNEIEKTGIRNILDIGCGYSPRGVLFVRKGYHYAGADIPAAVREAEPAVMKCVNVEDAARIKYVPVDATNPRDILNAASVLDGPVCVVTEGMFMYFPVYELNEYVKGLKMLLELHGGCIITPDFCMNKLLKVSMGATAGRTLGIFFQKIAEKVVKGYTVPLKEKKRKGNESRKSAGSDKNSNGSKSGVVDSCAWYSMEDDNEPFEYFCRNGFEIERVPVYSPDIQLNSLECINGGRARKFAGECENIYGWKMTLGNQAGNFR